MKKEATVIQTFFLKFFFTFRIIIVRETVFIWQSHNCYKRKNSDIKQRNTKNPKIKFMFLLLFHCFLITQPEIELQPNINLIKINKKKQRIQREYWIREERGPWGFGWITLSRLMRWRERQTDRQSVEVENRE